MGRYTKSTSTYTIKKKAQNINGGSIYERDWTTLGERLRFGPGKTPIYTDGNFVFTTSKIQTPTRKTKTNEVVEVFTYDQVKNTKPDVNNIDVYPFSDDITSYVYYGSCVDLVEGAVAKIIATFPGCFYTKNQHLTKYDNEELALVSFPDDNWYIVENPFLMDFFTQNPKLTENDNELRYIYASADQYNVKFTKTEGEEKVTVTGDVTKISSELNFPADCPQSKFWDNENGESIGSITFSYKTENDVTGDIKIDVYLSSDGLIYLTDKRDFELCPKKEIIEEYFSNLHGFEKLLLTRKTNPLYTNTFRIPLEPSNSGYVYKESTFTWPTIKQNHYCINVEDMAITTFVETMLEMANAYDNFKCDNLYGRMTHEAIKNYDWTYTQEYLDGDEEIFVEGGEQMKSIIHLIGRTFDDLKLYIDGIKSSNTISYDGNNNMPEAMLSDKAELMGWDTVSVIPTFQKTVSENEEDENKQETTIGLTQEFLTENNIKWYNSRNVEGTNTSTMDNDFMRRLVLSSKRIFETKGTQQAIEMVMGLFGLGRNKTNNDGDYKIWETYYTCYAKPNVKQNDDNRLLSEHIEDIILKTDMAVGSMEYDNVDLFENVPLKIIEEKVLTGKVSGKEEYAKKSFIIPYYRENEFTRDYYCFQSKGGWGQYGVLEYEDEQFYENCETVSYLNVLSNISELFNISSITSNKGDIYFVIDISDYETVFGSNEDANNGTISHFFYLSNEYFPDRPESWKNILNSWKESSEGSEQSFYYKKSQYLNKIVLNTLGNNPHVGYGYYDNGNLFKEYMQDPFKIQRDNYMWTNDIPTDETLDQYKFEMGYVEHDNAVKTSDEGKTTLGCLFVEDGKISEEDYSLSENEYIYKINSKVVILENKHDNDLYKQYFRTTILPYVMQVIPSTTILILRDF